MKTVDQLAAVVITNEAEAQQWLRDMHEAGLIYHPDDPAETIVNASGVSLFTPQQAYDMNVRMDWVFAYIEDPYEFILALDPDRE